jgi:hypothetical protein
MAVGNPAIKEGSLPGGNESGERRTMGMPIPAHYRRTLGDRTFPGAAAVQYRRAM